MLTWPWDVWGYVGMQVDQYAHDFTPGAIPPDKMSNEITNGQTIALFDQ